MIKEFKEFISRGNVLELAVGLIMATYFGAIVKSFVNDIIMPVVGQMIAGVDFATLKWQIGEKVLEDGTVEGVYISYGVFLNTIITFIIVSFAVFLVIKSYNNFLRKQDEEPPAAPPEPSAEEKLLTEIRDLLRADNK
jgi:large conductance mechanosensitive channel